MIEFITQNLPEMLELMLAIIGLAAVIVKFTPTPKDDAVIAKIYELLKVFALSKDEPNNDKDS